MFVGDTNQTLEKATSWIDSIANAVSKLKGGAKQIKADISQNVAREVAPVAAKSTAIAAIVGSAVMLGLVLVVMNVRKRRK